MRALCLLLCLLWVGAAAAQQPSANQAKIAQLQQEIAQLKDQLAAKERELATLLPALDPFNFKLGQTGSFPPQNDKFYFEVSEVRSPMIMVLCPVKVSERGFRDRGSQFILLDYPTRGLVDGARASLEGRFWVEEAARVPPYGTIFVLHGVK